MSHFFSFAVFVLCACVFLTSLPRVSHADLPLFFSKKRASESDSSPSRQLYAKPKEKKKEVPYYVPTQKKQKSSGVYVPTTQQNVTDIKLKDSLKEKAVEIPRDFDVDMLRASGPAPKTAQDLLAVKKLKRVETTNQMKEMHAEKSMQIQDIRLMQEARAEEKRQAEAEARKERVRAMIKDQEAEKKRKLKEERLSKERENAKKVSAQSVSASKAVKRKAPKLEQSVGLDAFRKFKAQEYRPEREGRIKAERATK